MSLDLAIKLSQSREAKSYYAKWPMAAVLVKGGSIQSIGFSRKKNDPTYLDRFDYCSVHCEIEALGKFVSRLRIMFCSSPEPAKVEVSGSRSLAPTVRKSLTVAA
jgi:tRNA(Arg) A34 adenosine deaminase TadA